ncbi:cysteine desulfurase family protein [soil metagenome]
MSHDHIDLDRAATTPVHVDVLDAMLPYFRERAGNPSSIHAAGRMARRGLEEARERVAAALRAAPSAVIFTSGATEALHLGVFGTLASRGERAHVVSAVTEHAATLAAVRTAQRRGAEVTWIEPDADGVIDPDEVVRALRDDTALVALMRVNNETGVITDVARVGDAVRERRGALLVDAVQAFGMEEVSLDAFRADMIALSAHKVEGPKGIGALVVRPGLRLEGVTLGGAQERGLRAGTPAVASAVGFGVAAEFAATGAPDRARRVAALRDALEAAIAAHEGVLVNGAGAPRGPKHLNVRIAAVDGEALLINLDGEGVLASAGSACAAGSIEASHVLMAMGLSRVEAASSVRFSLDDHLDHADVARAATRIVRAIARTRAVPV